MRSAGGVPDAAGMTHDSGRSGRGSFLRSVFIGRSVELSAARRAEVIGGLY
jgi:hypothetical protein